MKAELSQAGIEYDERDFFAEPFTVEELREIIGTRPVSEFFSWRSPSFRKMGLSRDDLRDDRLLQLMVDEPRLIRRPMILTGDGDLIVGTDKKAIAALVGSGSFDCLNNKLVNQSTAPSPSGRGLG